MKYHKTARPLALLVASILALQPVSALAVTFADINQVPWPGAETSINKAADLGLVVGETINGKSYFRPKDSVSLSESCQFTYKVLLQTKKITADSSVTEKWKNVLNTYQIQDWAHPAVSFCLENGIISISDLSGYVKNGMNVAATREQAAEMLGRALTVGAPSYSATASNTKFNDNANIATDARPYIALLNEAGIVNGDDLKNFNPKKTLNRTETAVMVTNLYSKLNSVTTTPATTVSTSVSGTVTDMNSLYVNLDGRAAYYLYSSNGVTATLNGSSSSIDALVTLFKDGTTMKATLTLDGNTRITKLVVEAAASSDEATAKATEGTLTKVTYDDDDDDGSIVIDKTSTYKFNDDDVSIKIDDKNYDLEDLYELFEDCKDDGKTIEVELTLNSKGKLTKIVGTVEDSEDADDDTVKGEVKSLSYDEDDEEGSIKIGSKTYKVKDTEDVSVKIDGKTKDYEKLYDLYEDDEYLYVTLTLDTKDNVTKIVASTEEEEDDDADEAEGKIEKMEWKEDKDTGTIKIGGNTYKISDTDDVKVEVQDGDTKIKAWKDLYNAYKDGKEIEVELVIDDDEVEEITGKVTVATGYLTGFDDKYLKLKGKKSDKTTKYHFTEYDRDDEDEEEDWEDDAEGIKISGLRNISTLYDFFEDWLDDDDTKLGTDEDKDDVFYMEFTLDKKGNITKIKAEQK